MVGRTRGVSGEMSADAIVEVIRALDNEVLVVLVERHGELVEEPLRSENTLKRHLKCSILHEGNARFPCDFRVAVEGEIHMLELDMPGSSKDSDRPALRPGLVESDPDCLARAAIEEADRGTGVNQSAECPIAGVAVLQADVESGPENRRISLLPVREEVVDAAQPTPITMSSVRRGTYCATAPAAD
jgi:hypothetical protein